MIKITFPVVDDVFGCKPNVIQGVNKQQIFI